MACLTEKARPIQELKMQLARLPRAWIPTFRRRLYGLERRERQGRPFEHGLNRLKHDLADVRQRYEQRQSQVLQPDFSAALPIMDRRAEIVRALSAHQVVVVCGDTGSGKSTQLPQIALALGLGVEGMIAHTQPRRIAARSLATRIAEELNTEVGAGVGYKVRFSDRVRFSTRLKLVTDGMLLAETQADPDLAQYDTIIIDEAHERSLNIDFLLGYLKRLLPRRPELKVIITSATIDPQRFSRYFNGAPIIQIAGRSHPVEIRYRPLVSEDEDERDRSLPEAILEALDELAAEAAGDVLVFLPSERDIREAAESLRKHHPLGTEVLPLFGRLSATEQLRVFAPHDRRRIVLATNVAETSLTVPGIRHVVDSGLARISRYSYRTKVQRLPIEPISRASADQRAGRCGREAPGVCIRLYAEADYQGRVEFTEPEILRTNLAAVILQMKYLKLGEIERFDFIDPPDPRAIRDGLKLLYELGAVAADNALTELGRRLAALPVDPRIARMLVAGETERALSEVLVIAAALSIPDPRQRPMDAPQAADAAQARWRDQRSDFLALVKLWNEVQEKARELSQRKLRLWCAEHFLSFVRLREWRDIHHQLRELVKGIGWRENVQEADAAAVHRALLTGLLGNIALRTDEQHYIGARGLKLLIFPGSGIAKRRPRWIVAAELVETSRIFARTVAEIRPEWVEPLAAHLVQRRYFEPFWEEKKSRVAGYESVTLYGLPLVARRKIDYTRVDPAAARALFIREGLVHGRLRTQGGFLAHNRRLIAEIEALEAKLRRRDVLVDEGVLAAFYAERVPAGLADGASFERWVRRPEHDQALCMTPQMLMEREAVEITADAYPEHLSVGGMRLPLHYHFEPDQAADGVTVIVPPAALNQLSPERFEWLVPGLLQEKVVALIRSLPKRLRRNFVPAPEFAAAILAAVPQGTGSLTQVVRDELKRMTGVLIPCDAWEGIELAAHLQMNFRVVDAHGRTVGEGRDLVALQRELGAYARAQAGDARRRWERRGLQRWDFDTLGEPVEFNDAGITLRGYPAVVDEGGSVALHLLDSPAQAARTSLGGIRKLFMLQLPDQAKYLRRKLPGIDRLCLLYSVLGSCEAFKQDFLAAAYQRVFMPDGTLPRTREAFQARLQAGREELIPTATRLAQTLLQILEHYQEARQRFKAPLPPAQLETYRDMREQLDAMIYAGFVQETPAEWLGELPRYMRALVRRLEQLQRDPEKDRRGLQAIRPLWEQYRRRCEQHVRQGIEDPQLEHYRWLLEEYRVSLFAQELGTREKVSEKRLHTAWQRVR
ncbi:MAG: ATP-dependent RNA helicase HrpA [Nitrococcus mobilis]|nr:ATP-dependent RNA helicase HrpA [Nitrococcus mobilis]